MPSRVPAVRYTEARHSSKRTSLSSAGVSWRTLMGYPSYARNRACAWPSPSPFHCVMAKIVPVVQLAAHAKGSTLYGRSYGRTSKFFQPDGFLPFRIIMGLRCARYSMLLERRILPFSGGMYESIGTNLFIQSPNNPFSTLLAFTMSVCIYFLQNQRFTKVENLLICLKVVPV